MSGAEDAAEGLTTRQQVLLVNGALKWIQRLRQIEDSLGSPPEALRSSHPEMFGKWFEDSLVAAYTIPLALAQLHRHLGFLSSNGWSGGSPFLAAFDAADVRTLRNALEHEADYVAGIGHNPDAVVNSGQGPGINQKLTGGVTGVGAFGKHYPLEEVLNKARSLTKLLEILKTELLAQPE